MKEINKETIQDKIFDILSDVKLEDFAEEMEMAEALGDEGYDKVADGIDIRILEQIQNVARELKEEILQRAAQRDEA